jgi:dihydroorotase
MLSALRLASTLGLPIMVHCEDPELAKGGGMHRGAVSEELGDIGIPAAAEEDYIERDLRLADQAGGWLHILHVSTVRGAEMIRTAKARGIRVTAEVMPHHMTLTDEWVAGRRRYAGDASPSEALGQIDTNAKVNPPLRPETDALGLAAFVRDGTFEFIATDHAPHAAQDKPDDLSKAASGMLGLEVAIPSLAMVISRGELDWPIVIRKLTSDVASTLGLPGGDLSVGVEADVTVIDPERVWTIDRETLQSKSKNTPLLGMEVRGRAVMTIVGGAIKHDVL